MEEVRQLPIKKGIYFEEYAVGQTATTVGRTITETDVVAFAALSGDWNPIHSDAVYAAQDTFGQRIAHGLLGLSIASGLAVRLGFMDETVLAFREIADWKFSQPIYLNDTIHVCITVIEKRPVPRLGGGLVTFEVEIHNQDDKIVQHGQWRVLFKSKPA